MIQLYAPHPNISAVLMLPDAEWGDVQRLESSMQMHRSMNGARVVTHIRKLPNIRTYEIQLLMTRKKALEFIEFFNIFGADKMQLQLDKDTSVVGYLKLNPMELEFTKRAVSCDSLEEVSTRFDFESII